MTVSDVAPAKAAPLVEARGLQPGYLGHHVMPPVDWALARGEVWALVGDNGSGKSTLLRTLLGLQPACGGKVLKAEHHVVAYMAQRGSIDARLPMRVRDYLLGGAERGYSFVRPFAARAHGPRLQALTRQLGLERLLDAQVARLSEGQTQRVALGRALMGAPDVLVLDEPTSAMDMATEAQMLALLAPLAQSADIAIVIVGHHLQALLAATTHWAWARGAGATLLHGPRAEMACQPDFAAHFAAVLPAKP